MEADCKDRMVSWKKSKQGNLNPENSQPAQAIGTHIHTIGVVEWTVLYMHLGIFGKSPLHMKSRREFLSVPNQSGRKGVSRESLIYLYSGVARGSECVRDMGT